jgi:SUN domain-containing protein 1/2
LTIRLSEAVAPTAVTVEHLNKVFSERAGDSAPKNFRVFGYADASELENALSSGVEENEPLYSGTYDIEAENPIQTFAIRNKEKRVVNFVRLEVTTNHGNEDYTCLYRFRVHAE